MALKIIKKIKRPNFVAQLILSLLFGSLTVLSMQPWGIFPIIWLTIPSFLILLDCSKNYKNSFLTAWFFGLGYFGLSFFWITNAFYVDEKMYGIIAIPAVLILSAGFAIYIGIIGLLLHSYQTEISKKTNTKSNPENKLIALWYKLILFASLWAIIEWFRGWLFTGFPWNPIGNIWANISYPSQSVSIFGIYGLSLVTVLSASSPSFFINGDKAKSRYKFIFIIICNLPLILLSSWGIFRVHNADLTYVDNINLRLVQPNITQKEKWVPKLRRKHIEKLVMMSNHEADGITHVIWPEAAVTYALNRNKPLLEYILLSFPNDTKLITGSPRTEINRNLNTSYNSLYVISNFGVEAVYDKVHLVPFGEYTPSFVNFFGFNKLIYTAGQGFKHGKDRLPISLGNLPSFMPIICYEIIFSGNLYETKHNPEWLLNITNDAWFGKSSGPYQHFANVRMRSIEHGLPAIRVANSGITAVIDGYGRVINKIDINKTGTIDTGLPQKLAPTLFNYFRHSLFFALSIILILATLRFVKYKN
ncbi:MAG: apolipoprotein N-acyltransferase [Alphaproteobacteria bacterium TMED87]|nr:apolipoprotein N-acyltransferase [Rhodospirillaceae bacterium]OUV10434.1 MAG: apolipoprotein N-acyltransferase [Alphaproteobacteria bacterium TMED87]